MSLRLRSLLLAAFMEIGQDPPSRVLPKFNPDNYRSRHFARACKKAPIGHRQPKDLRDSYASHLLTAGIRLGYISEQLGHKDEIVTAQRYAKEIAECSYIYTPPRPIPAFHHPADLLEIIEAEGRDKPIERSSYAPKLDSRGQSR